MQNVNFFPPSSWRKKEIERIASERKKPNLAARKGQSADLQFGGLVLRLRSFRAAFIVLPYIKLNKRPSVGPHMAHTKLGYTIERVS